MTRPTPLNRLDALTAPRGLALGAVCGVGVTLALATGVSPWAGIAACAALTGAAWRLAQTARPVVRLSLLSVAPTTPEPPHPTDASNAPQPAAPPFVRMPRTRYRPAMLPIRGGTFLMGTPPDQAAALIARYNHDVGDRERLHEATVGDFHLSATHVTQADFEAVMGWNPSHFTAASGGGPTHPVDQVTWVDAVAFCNALSEREGRTPAYRVEGENARLVQGADGYRLPTEAEWEFAARAGTSGACWAGDGEDALASVAWYSRNSGGRTHPVGSLPANGFGVHDALGNLWCICQDLYEDRTGEAPAESVGPGGGLRVIRGGCWHNGADEVRAGLRDFVGTVSRGHNVGFRIALSGPPPPIAPTPQVRPTPPQPGRLMPGGQSEVDDYMGRLLKTRRPDRKQY
ncbi:formylglycine-generating enzyme family protein [Myxococcota bacterium]|nr:formylglycine-generating enzyme family protein [Myxococcota bacterium]